MHRLPEAEEVFLAREARDRELRILTSTTSPVKSLGGFGSKDLMIPRTVRKQDRRAPIKNSTVRNNQTVDEGLSTLECTDTTSSRKTSIVRCKGRVQISRGGSARNSIALEKVYRMLHKNGIGGEEMSIHYPREISVNEPAIVKVQFPLSNSVENSVGSRHMPRMHKFSFLRRKLHNFLNLGPCHSASWGHVTQ